MAQPGENLKKKDASNDWCGGCGGGGGEMKRKERGGSLTYCECSRCNGAGVVKKVKPIRK